jgi:hypothetical protein
MSIYIWLAFARFTFSWLRLHAGLAAASRGRLILRRRLGDD